MTVLCYDGITMAADSGAWSSSSQQTVPFPKITRAPDGSLAGLAGKLSDSWWLREWMLAGMPENAKPVFTGKDDDEPHIMMVRPDRSCWFARGSLRFTPHPWPTCVGEESAAAFCEGVMATGASAAEAVRLAAMHCQSALDPVQIERPGPVF